MRVKRPPGLEHLYKTFLNWCGMCCECVGAIHMQIPVRRSKNLIGQFRCLTTAREDFKYPTQICIILFRIEVCELYK